VNLGLLILLILIVTIITGIYISQEKYFYYWDYANYSSQTVELALAFRNSWTEGFKLFQESLSSDYNKIPCLPLIPFILIFGDSRLVYILSLMLIYFIPFALVMGFIVQNLLQKETKYHAVYTKAIFWSTVFFTLAIPTPWVSTLRSYPDIGALLIMGLAILVYLKDTLLKSWWQTPLIGFLLGLTILFRRHYGYSVRAFIIAIICQELIIYLTQNSYQFKTKLTQLIRYEILICLISITTLLTIKLIAPEFLPRLITIDYDLWYNSYKRSVWFVIKRYTFLNGALLWFFVISGYLLALTNNIFSRSLISFFLIFGSLSCVQWIFLVQQKGIHHGTQISFFLVIGLSLFFWSTYFYLRENFTQVRFKSIAIFLGTLLVINLSFSLTNIGKFNNIFRLLFAETNAPLVRKDYEQVVSFIDYLRDLTPNGESIYIAASSRTFNPSIITNAELTIYGKKNQKLYILPSPDVDSRDYYPLRYLQEADYIIVGNPYQYHISPEQHNVIKVVVDTFQDHWEFAKDFEKLPESFNLDDETKVTINIYKRIKPTSLKTTIDTLQKIQNNIKYKPGLEVNWLRGKSGFANINYLNQGLGYGTINLEAELKNQQDEEYFLYYGEIPKQVNFTAQIGEINCSENSQILAKISTLDQQGNRLQTIEENLTTDHKQDNLILSLSGEGATYLLLSLQSVSTPQPHTQNVVESDSYCLVKLDNLTVN
jgi:hypothetical protein